MVMFVQAKAIRILTLPFSPLIQGPGLSVLCRPSLFPANAQQGTRLHQWLHFSPFFQSRIDLLAVQDLSSRINPLKEYQLDATFENKNSNKIIYTNYDTDTI